MTLYEPAVWVSLASLGCLAVSQIILLFWEAVRPRAIYNGKGGE